MASSDAQLQQQQPIPVALLPSPQVVGNAFVQQYYHILHQSPKLVHRFYQDISKLGRPEADGLMGLVTTQRSIDEKIQSLDYGKFNAEIKTVDAQDSHNGAVLVLVTGYLTKDGVKRTFTQTFFLAPQNNGYFVLNDMFRYVDDATNDKIEDVAGEDSAPVTPDEESAVVLEDQGQEDEVQEDEVQEDEVQEDEVPEEVTASSEEAIEEVYNPPENGEALPAEEAPVPEVVDAVQDDSHSATESNAKVECVQKKSYASIVKDMKDSSIASSNVVPAPISFPKDQQVVSPPPSAAVSSDTSLVDSTPIENGYSKEVEAEGYSIYVKNLPMSATPSHLEAAFRQFGAIKSNGIQVRSNKGFCFGFIEFDSQSSVDNALQASVVVDGYSVQVEIKKSNSRGNRLRYPNGRGGGGGFRGDGARGRGNYGAVRGYNRSDFNNRGDYGNRTDYGSRNDSRNDYGNRSDYGNRVDYGNRSDYGNRNGGRGGYPNRGGDGFQRGEHMGNNGSGRQNRTGGVGAANGMAKNMAQQVSTTA